MTPYTTNRYHIRELIRGFARIDECFDSPLYAAGGALTTKFHSLACRLEFLLSFPVKENSESTNTDISPEQLRRIGQLIPDHTEDKPDDHSLRGRLRDCLYEFLLRLEDCSDEELSKRSVSLPTTCLSLLQLKELVVFMAEGTITGTQQQLSEAPVEEGKD